MSDHAEASRVPKMTAERAQEVARGYKWLAQSLSEAGAPREASRLERESLWWMAYSISLGQTPPDGP